MIFIEYCLPKRDCTSCGPLRSTWICSKRFDALGPSLVFGSGKWVCFPRMQWVHFGGISDKLIVMPIRHVILSHFDNRSDVAVPEMSVPCFYVQNSSCIECGGVDDRVGRYGGSRGRIGITRCWGRNGRDLERMRVRSGDGMRDRR
jgi:hypothetical protein